MVKKEHFHGDMAESKQKISANENTSYFNITHDTSMQKLVYRN